MSNDGWKMGGIIRLHCNGCTFLFHCNSLTFFFLFLFDAFPLTLTLPVFILSAIIWRATSSFSLSLKTLRIQTTSPPSEKWIWLTFVYDVAVFLPYRSLFSLLDISSIH